MSQSPGQTTRIRLAKRISASNLTALQRREHDATTVATAAPGASREEDSTSRPRRRGTRRVLIGAAVAVVLLAGLLLGLIADSRADTDRPERPRVLAVQTVRLEPVSSYQTLREYTGVIVARRTSQLGFELAGKLEEIYVDEGDRVKAGSALAQLDTEHLETRRRQLVAKRAQARAKLDEMVQGPRDEEIAAARARVESLQADVQLWQLQRDRQEKLVASNASSQNTYERSLFGLKARQAQLDEAQQNLAELLNGTRKEQITAQRAAVAELDASIADVDVDLSKSTLKAPYAGTIARRLADDGTVVETGQAVFRLVEDHVLEAWIGLPILVAGRLGEDSPHRVKVGHQHFDATLAGRFPEVDPETRTRTIVLALEDSAASQVIHGQVVRLELEETVAASGYWLPSTALSKAARGLWTSFVAVPTDSSHSIDSDLFRVERRDIEVLHTESQRVLVRGTLHTGDRVISSGTHRIVPGQLVRLTK